VLPAVEGPASVAARDSAPRVEHVVAVRGESSAAEELQRMAVLQLLSVLAAILLAPLVLALVFFRMLPRSAGGAGPLFRVEFIGSQGPGVQPVFVTTPPPAAPAERPQPPAEAPPFLPRDPAEIERLTTTFELGPSYEQETHAHEQREQEQHGALLQHIFEENLQLQEQLAGAPAGAE